MKIIDFRGEITDISAKKEALRHTWDMRVPMSSQNNLTLMPCTNFLCTFCLMHDGLRYTCQFPSSEFQVQVNFDIMNALGVTKPSVWRFLTAQVRYIEGTYALYIDSRTCLHGKPPVPLSQPGFTSNFWCFGKLGCEPWKTLHAWISLPKPTESKAYAIAMRGVTALTAPYDWNTTVFRQNFHNDGVTQGVTWLCPDVHRVRYLYLVVLFSKLNIIFFGYFDPIYILLHVIKCNDCRGDIIDISTTIKIRPVSLCLDQASDIMATVHDRRLSSI